MVNLVESSDRKEPFVDAVDQVGDVVQIGMDLIDHIQWEVVEGKDASQLPLGNLIYFVRRQDSLG